MSDLLAIVRELLAGLDVRRRWIVFVAGTVLFLAGLYAYDCWTGWSFYAAAEKKVDLLERLHTLARDGIAQDPDLAPIYRQLVNDLYEHHRSLLVAAEARGPDLAGKALGGASIWLVFAVLAGFGIFGRENRLAAVFALVFLALLFGWLGTRIPTLYDPWVNSIGFPLLQLVVLFLLGRSKRSKTAR